MKTLNEKQEKSLAKIKQKLVYGNKDYTITEIKDGHLAKFSYNGKGLQTFIIYTDGFMQEV